MENITVLWVWEFERVNSSSLFLHLQKYHPTELYNFLLRRECIYLPSNCHKEKVELSNIFIMVQNCILAHHPRLKNLFNSLLISFGNIIQRQ